MYSSILKIIFFSLVLYKTTEAAVSLFGPEEKPAKYANQKGCYLSILELVLKVNVPYSPQDDTSCEQYTCKKNGVTQHFTCGAKAVSEGCEKMEGDKTLSYPDCCDYERCYYDDGTYIDYE